MRSCKFYTPSNAESENHKGLEPSDYYDFDRLPTYNSSCKCPSRLANSSLPVMSCGFPLDQVACPDYAAEEDHFIRKVYIHEEGKTQTLELTMTRLRFSIAEYHVTLITEESSGFEQEEMLLHQINAHEHGNLEARSMADELFKHELEDLRNNGSKSIIEGKHESKNTSSYLEKVKVSS